MRRSSTAARRPIAALVGFQSSGSGRIAARRAASPGLSAAAGLPYQCRAAASAP